MQNGDEASPSISPAGRYKRYNLPILTNIEGLFTVFCTHTGEIFGPETVANHGHL